ncbi:MAG: sigma 54-interacting transcriptional regulator, partial [Myxococcaceae bacterium]
MSPPLPRLRLLVVGEAVSTHWLPDSGTVTLGQNEDCDIRVREPNVLPRHLRIHVAEEVTLEPALTPVRLGDALLSAGQRRALRPGEPLSMGDTLLLVLQRRQRLEAPPRAIWSHGFFEARLEEECLRADRYGSSFAILRLSTVAPAPGTELRTRGAVEEVLASTLRGVDGVASYGPGEYEVLLPDTPPENVSVVSTRLREELSLRGAQGAIGAACYPQDGRDAHSLIARAGAEARGESAAEPASSVLPSRPVMRELEGWVERIAQAMISVLILGETGVGKERLAEGIHQRSKRAAGPFLRLNCAALSESLLESELFGHEKGSFTGAVSAKQGLLETAHGGTVFFDEVGELPLSMQAKLLRVIEERKATRVGGLKPYSIDVRFVSATNRNLEEEIERGRFRDDLYFRLNGISLVIPPLRDRKEEIAGIAEGFISEVSRRSGRAPAPRLAKQTLAVLEGYRWPGNIRELRNVIERAVLLCLGETILPEHVPMDRLGSSFASRKPQAEVKPQPPSVVFAQRVEPEEEATTVDALS